jgi:hypothetical protein
VVGAQLTARVLRLDPRRRVATVAVPSVGRGPSFRAEFAGPGEGLAGVVELVHGAPGGRTVGTVVAVRGQDGGALDVNVKRG